MSACSLLMVQALSWREHVDLIAKTLMIKQQTCYGVRL